MLLVGMSVKGCGRAHELDRGTVRRWWGWLQARGPEFELHLRSRFADLGRHGGFEGFWSALLAGMGQARAIGVAGSGSGCPVRAWERHSGGQVRCALR